MISDKRIVKRKIIFILAFLTIVLAPYTAMAAQSPDTEAEAHAVAEVQTGRILYSKNGDTPMSMASTTKIMTGILAVESGKLGEVVTIPPEAVGVEGSSIYLEQGEQFTLEALTYGLMLRSGNDSAEAIAIYLAGDVPTFVQQMNAKARELGCTSTNFMNPHGLPADNHYTTANDLARITAYAMRNPDFKRITSTKYIEVDPSGEGLHRTFKNKNKLLWNLDGATGVKTGYTKEAGKCLVGSAERSGTEVVAVVLNCGAMWDDTTQLINSALQDFGMVEVLADGTSMGDIVVTSGQANSVSTACSGSFSLPLAEGEMQNVHIDIELPAYIQAPVKQGDVIGKVYISYEGVEYGQLDILTCEDIMAEGFKFRFHQVISEMIGL